MKLRVNVLCVSIFAALAVATFWPAVSFGAQNIGDAIRDARGVYAADRRVFLAENLQLTDSEAAAFWPLYDQFRAEQEKVGDGLVKLVLEYADVYPNVPEDHARQMLKDYSVLEQRLADQRTRYLKKFGKVLPASKVLRFAQLQNRMDLGLRLQLASTIPLAPVEGRLRGESTAGVALAEGIPGGIAVQTYELTATVAAISPATRQLTLLSPDGIKQTVKVGPEAVNFDQIHVGDQLKVTMAEQLLITIAGDGENAADQAAALVALAPKGAKPGGLLAQTTRVTAEITAIDAENRKATLRFEDGSARTVAVRPDVDLSKRKVGEKVVIRLTEAMALTVNKPQ